jgi:CHAT domain-containing protein
LVTVILTVDEGQHVLAAQMTLSRSFIVDPVNGRFAGDIAQSFLLACITDPEASPEIYAAAAAIRRPSEEILNTSEALRVYAGMHESCTLPLPKGSLRMWNLPQRGGGSLVFRARANLDSRALRVRQITQSLKTATPAERVKLCREGLKLLNPVAEAETYAALNGTLAESLMTGKPGPRGRDLDEAIEAYQIALRSFPPEANLRVWIISMLDLVEAYRKRSELNQSGDLEDVIAREEQLLGVMPKDEAPEDWAQLNARLAADYQNRNQGSAAENRRKAMQCYAAALEAWPPETSGSAGFETTAKLVRLANQTDDAEGREFQGRAVAWLEAFANFLRGRTNPAERAAANDELRAALGVIPADPRPDAQKATQRMVPYLMLSQTLAQLAQQYIRNPGDDEEAAHERAIAALEEALQQIPADAMADVWSSNARILAGLYQLRRKGERSQNIERVFELYEQVLDGPIRFIDPKAWVRMLQEFSAAYVARKQSRADRLDRLVAWLQTAIELPVVAKDVRERAMVRWGLGHAHTNYPTGDRGEHIEQSIVCYQAALADLGKRKEVQLRASLANDLGIAFAKRTKGDRVENLEEAITYLEEATRLWNPRTAGRQWAGALMNLGIAYSQRERGNKVENLDRSLESLQQSLQVITRESDPFTWASVMHNIGNLFLRRREVDQGASIEQARQAYEDVLTVRTAENVPDDWAVTMSNMGKVYLNRVEGDAEANYEKGIEYCIGALTIRTRETNAHEWAETLNHLGNLHHRLYMMKRREPGDGWREHFEQARTAYGDALEVVTPDTQARASIPLAQSLANLYTDEERWQESLVPFRLALHSAERLYQASIFRATREVQLEHTGDLYRRAAYAMAQADEGREAVCTLERGRARGLSESLALDRKDLSRVEAQDPQAFAAFRDAAARLRQVEEMERNSGEAAAQEQLRKAAQSAREELESALAGIRRIAGLENFLQPVSWEEIRAQVQPGAPLVYLAAAPEGTLTALLARNSESEEVVLETWTNPAFGEGQLYSLIGGGGRDGDRPGWITAYLERAQSGSDWNMALERVCGEIWAPIMQPLMEKTRNLGADELVVIPCGLFGFLPLHAARSGEGAESTYALDVAAFCYAPSASVLAAARHTAATVKPDALLVVAEPSPMQQAGPLPNAEDEVRRITALFEHKTVLAHSQASHRAVLKKLPTAKVVHFACHGGTDWQEPLSSSLLLAHDRPLRVADLLSLRLEGARLAALSACETAIVGSRLPDEVVSLPTALLQAGFAGVIASMWSVLDLSTALLMPRIYQLWIQDAVAPHQALRQAVQWLRKQTAADLAKTFEVTRGHAAESGGEDYQRASDAWQHFAYDYAPEDQPYAHVVHWAAFTFTGA